MDTVKRLTALQTALVDKLEKQPYLRPAIRITTNSNPYYISWCVNDIYDDVDFTSETLEAVFKEAEAHVEALPDVETLAIQKFQKDLAKVIDGAPPSIDTAPLSAFNATIHENLLTCAS